ncbi:prepilin peptidase [Enterobacter sp. CPE_E222]
MAEKEVVKHLPHFSILVFSIAVLVYYLSSDVLLFVFCLTLAITAYTDACTRWIPDPVIYALIAISVYSLNSKDFSESLYSVAFYVMPVLLLSLYGYVVKKESWIASGDYYVFLSIGLMLIPEYAAGTMLVTLAIMLILMRWVKQIPLVTVAYFTFTGFNICLFSGFL